MLLEGKRQALGGALGGEARDSWGNVTFQTPENERGGSEGEQAENMASFGQETYNHSGRKGMVVKEY